MRSCWLVCVLALILSGCTSIEHRDDMPEKKKLSAIEPSLHPVKKWSAAAGHGVDKHDVKLLLARAGRKLYTVDHAGQVIAFDENNGKEVWRLDLRTTVASGPSVDDGKLVVGTSDGKVIAVDIDKGSLAWVSPTTSEVLAAPRIANGMVFVHTMDGSLNALSLEDGRQLWRFTHSLPSLMLRRASTPVARNENLIAGFATGKLLSLRMADGSVDWTQDVGHPRGRNDLQRMIDISADPVLKGDKVYAASYQGNLVAIDVESGHLAWERDIASYSGFVADNKLIYVAETNGNVAAVEQTSGATFWLQDELQGRRLSKPAIMRDFIVVADEDGYVHWIEKSSGKIVARFQTDKAGVEATPMINNNIVYILGRSGKLVALEVK